jgi:orotate phosphoribosyltransferase
VPAVTADPDAEPLANLLADPVLAGQHARLRELLRTLSFQEREVTLSSGLKSNFYIDCKQVSLDSEGHVLIGMLFRAVIDRVAPDARAVGGLTLGADPLASATATMSFLGGRPLHAFIVRKEPKGHGTGQWVEQGSRLPAGAKVVVVEDVVTTGASTIKAIERARGHGLDVAHVVALVDRLEGGRDAVEKLAPLTTLFTRKDFLA